MFLNMAAHADLHENEHDIIHMSIFSLINDNQTKTSIEDEQFVPVLTNKDISGVEQEQ